MLELKKEETAEFAEDLVSEFVVVSWPELYPVLFLLTPFTCFPEDVNVGKGGKESKYLFEYCPPPVSPFCVFVFVALIYVVLICTLFAEEGGIITMI